MDLDWRSSVMTNVYIFFTSSNAPFLCSLSGSVAAHAVATIVVGAVLFHDVDSWNGLTIRWHRSTVPYTHTEMAASRWPSQKSDSWRVHCMFHCRTANDLQWWHLFIHITRLAHSFLGHFIAWHCRGEYSTLIDEFTPGFLLNF